MKMHALSSCFARASLVALIVLLFLDPPPRSSAVQSEKPSSPVPSPIGRLVDLGGYKLHLTCSGSGSPTVVLSAGAGDFSFDWALVQPKVAAFTRVCSYDRSGEAWSDLGPKPRTMYQEVFDLHRLLAAAGEHGPYVMVGQSLGGMIARLFAMECPAEVSGLVLVDAYHEDTQLFMNNKLVRIRTTAQKRPIPTPRSSVDAADGLTPEETKQIDEMISKFEIKPSIDPPYDKLPEWAKKDRVWALAQRKHFAATYDPYGAEEAEAIYEQTQRQTYPLRDLPLIVLCRSRHDYPPDQDGVLWAEHQKQQAALALLSRKGTETVVPDSGHHIHLDAPDAVTNAIRQLVLRLYRARASAI